MGQKQKGFTHLLILAVVIWLAAVTAVSILIVKHIHRNASAARKMYVQPADSSKLPKLPGE